MRSFEDMNPLVIFIYFITVSLIPVFLNDGIIYLLSLSGALIYFVFRNRCNDMKTYGVYSLFFLLLTIINPIVSHNGETVMFVVNNYPITLESVIYGFFSSSLVVSILYWFRIFSQIITTDKIIYIFAKGSPKLALILSMSLRYIPLFKEQYKKISNAQKVMGEYKDNNVFDKIKVGMKNFSTMVTWTLENGIITAESMDARGYGCGRRTNYAVFPFLLSEGIVLLIIFSITALCVFLLKTVEFAFYPRFIVRINEMSVAGYVLYFILTLLPLFLDVKENVKWKYLRQKI